MKTILLLICSNVFMTFAWYGHLKYRQAPLFLAIITSWGIAFFEYCFQVPANRIGSYDFTPVQLKIIQEIITLVVFCVFSYFYFGEKVGMNQIFGFICLVLAVYFMFKPT
ncbi:MAG: DMT family protein [Rhabdochlamydiaceae bacterium]|nr:DMT family protein [Rhabdochlamydiaceae bacterium]